MTYLTILTIWMIIGNIWVDLLNDIAKELEGEVDLKTRLINSLIWPYSIYNFMKEVKLGYEEKNIGDIPDTLNDMINAIDKHMAEKLNCDLEVYRKTIDEKCTDEEVNDIVSTIIENENEDEIKRVTELFNSKL
jgi:hypothetical protein